MVAERELRLVVTQRDKALFQRINAQHQRLGTQGSQAWRNIDSTAKGAGRSIQGVGRFSRFAFEVLQAFLLYKGFVFLKTQAQEFIGTLVTMDEQIQITNAQLNNLGQDFSPRFREDLIEVADETGVALDKLAGAQFNVISANVDVADSFDVVNLAAKAAVAGGIDDAKTAFESALTQANAFELGVERLDEAFDKQFNTVRRGIFTYEQFSGVVGDVSVAFSEFGQNIETTNAAVAAISQIFTGSQLRRGVTGIRNVAEIIREQPERLEAFGVAVTDAEGDFRNFIDIVMDLRDALDGLSEREQAAQIKELFPRKRAQRGVLGLLRTTDFMEQVFIEQQLALGDLDDAFETVNESIRVQADIVKNELIPALDPLLQTIDQLLEGFRGLADVTPGGTRTLAMAASAVTLGLVGRSAARAGGMPMTVGGPGRLGRFFGSATMGLSGLASTQPTGVGFGGAFPAAPLVAPSPNVRQPGMFRGGTFQRSRFTQATGLTTGGAAFAAGLPALFAFGAGRVPDEGIDVESFAQQVGTGGLLGFAGTGGNPLGAVVGAGAAAVAFGIGEALEGEAPDVARSFTEKLAESLRKESGDVVEALVTLVESSQEEQQAEFAEFFSPTIGRGGPVTFQRDPDLVEQIVIGITDLFKFGVTTGGLFDPFQLEDAPGPRRTLETEANIPGGAVGLATRIRGREDEIQRGIKQARELAPGQFPPPKQRDAASFLLRRQTQEEFQRAFGVETQEELDELLAKEANEPARLFRQRLLTVTDILAKSGADVEDFGRLFVLGATDLKAFFEEIRSTAGVIDSLAFELENLPDPTDLGERLIEASELVRQGLLPSMGFTADELDRFGTTLLSFNRQIAKVRVIEELARLADEAEITGQLRNNLENSLRTAIQNIELGGQSFMELLAEPERIADLLTEMEFGDVSVDNSTNQNIVVRISGGTDLDTQRASEFADAILRNLNERQREVMAR